MINSQLCLEFKRVFKSTITRKRNNGAADDENTKITQTNFEN